VEKFSSRSGGLRAGRVDEPGPVAAAEKVFEFKISLDTVPNHPRNMGWKSLFPN